MRPVVGTPLREAWWQALYGTDGFYLRERPDRHFRTASHAAAPQLADALLRLAVAAGCGRVVDVGAGSGELLAALAERPEAAGLDLVGVDLRPRPSGLPGRIRWLPRPPEPDGPGLLIGWELLDVVPCPVLRAGPEGELRELVVGPDGQPVPGPPADRRDVDWCRRWWPGPWVPGEEIEVGRTRDEFWAELVAAHGEGLALAVDYDHLRDARPAQATLLGYRDGVARAPELDGGMDLTAHVALDAVAHRVGTPQLLARQAELLTVLTGRPANPPHELSRTDPLRYLCELDRAGRHRELLDPRGLGGFGWLLSARGAAAAGILTDLTHRLGRRI